jgi:hypothetical protein
MSRGFNTRSAALRHSNKNSILSAGHAMGCLTVNTVGFPSGTQPAASFPGIIQADVVDVAG